MRWIIYAGILALIIVGAVLGNEDEGSNSGGYPGGDPIIVREVERWVVEFTNQERERAGLGTLSHDPDISTIARVHSNDMVRYEVLAHELMGKDPTGRALAAGYDCRADLGDGRYSYGLSENIAERPRVIRWSGPYGNMSPSTYDRDSEALARGLVRQWMTSPGHKKNIMDTQARRIGVGVAIDKMTKDNGWRDETIYATQNFSECN